MPPRAFVKRLIHWFLEKPPDSTTIGRVILWWELRRLPFNIVIGAYGIACFAAYFWAIYTSGELKSGEDALEPMAIFAAPFVINFFYTLGWLVEVPFRWFMPDLTPRFGPRLLKTGIALGIMLITLPAAYWVGYRVLQLTHVIS